MDLDHVNSFPVNDQHVDVYVTKPYPGDDDETSRIVVFSGTVCCPDPRFELFILPSELRPLVDTHLLCSPDGHYVEISSVSGMVTLVSPLAALLLPISVSLDNVKFLVKRTNATSPLTVVRPGLPGRPNLLVLNPSSSNAVNKFLLVPRFMDVSKPLLIPLGWFDKSSETCKMSVANIFHGGIDILGNPTLQHVIVPESVLSATERTSNDILCSMLDCPLDADSKKLLMAKILKKIPAVVYSKLSGEPEDKTLRRRIA